MARTTAKKAAGKSAEKDPRAPLLEELTALTREMDAEGLEFLIAQARVIKHNARVDELNRETEQLIAEEAELEKKRPKGSSAPPPKRRTLEIHRSDDGKTYHIVLNGKYKLFDAAEIVPLVRLSHGFTGDADACRALYAWFKRERGDAMSDFGIADASEPVLLDLVKLFRSNFRKPAAR